MAELHLLQGVQAKPRERFGHLATRATAGTALRVSALACNTACQSCLSAVHPLATHLQEGLKVGQQHVPQAVGGNGVAEPGSLELRHHAVQGVREEGLRGVGLGGVEFWRERAEA